jgi:uncharacterized repeat protein (TIGR03803 family)
MRGGLIIIGFALVCSANAMTPRPDGSSTASPTFSPAGGAYTTTQTVSISDTTSDASIYYTTNGSTPTTSSTKYATAIKIISTETLKAIAVAPEHSASTVASATYTITPVTATPIFSPAGGTYTTVQAVAISDATTGASVYYTTNGSTPTTKSTKYSGPISVKSTETIEAIATASGHSNSAVAKATYTIKPAPPPVVATPVFSPAAGTYSTAQKVSITDATAGAKIYYTTNGTVPTTSSTKYNGAITVSSNETIVAIALASGYTNSAVTSAFYDISVSAGGPKESAIYSFDGTVSSNEPYAVGTVSPSLVANSNGNFYGTMLAGGANGHGGIFKITPAGAYTLLYSFTNANGDGATPLSPLVFGSDGNLYGTTSEGGAKDQGTIFRITPAGVETVVYSLGDGSADGAGPIALIQGGGDTFFGITAAGGVGNGGTFFSVTSAGVEKVLHTFGSTATDSVTPISLILGSDGDFYGVAEGGGAHDAGTVFKITASGVESVLYSFQLSLGVEEGLIPISVIQGRDGNLYGTTVEGGAYDEGVVFKVTLAGVETVLHSFESSSGQYGVNSAEGAFPGAGLTLGNDGNLYGTTQAGGAYENGTIFRITPSGAMTTLYGFQYDSPKSLEGLIVDGNDPASTLVVGSDGSLYGTTALGGAHNQGVVFKLAGAIQP